MNLSCPKSIPNYNPIHRLIHNIKKYQVPSPSKSWREREQETMMKMVVMVVVVVTMMMRERRESDEIDLSPNHGWCVSGEEPKGTKISPRVTCKCFELQIHRWSSQMDDEIYLKLNAKKKKTIPPNESLVKWG
jgi:hypothetical protein